MEFEITCFYHVYFRVIQQCPVLITIIFKGVFIKSNVLVISFSVPLKDRGQFRSVWCHVVWDVVDSISQIMVSNEEKAEIFLYKKNKLNNLY